MSSASVPFSVLDLAVVSEGSSHGEALAQLGRPRARAEAARLQPLLGRRAPQHARDRQLGAGRARSRTSPPRPTTIRVGSGGVMLPNHAPLVIAEQFGMLEALHPGRIDLGIGRAPGTDQLTARGAAPLGRPASATTTSPSSSASCIGYFTGEFPDGHPFGTITAVPGSRRRARDLAARLERLQRPARRAARDAVLVRPPLQPRATPLPALELYRDSFRPSEELAEPYAMVARRRDLRRGRRAGALARRAGAPLDGSACAAAARPAIPTPEEAADHDFTRGRGGQRGSLRLGGRSEAPEQVRAGLDELVEQHRGRRADDHDDDPRPRRPDRALTSGSPSSSSSRRRRPPSRTNGSCRRARRSAGTSRSR